MADYHTVYKGPEGQTTQWDDIQRKMGNLPAKEPVKKADPFTPEREETRNKDWVDSKAADELEELEDEFDDDRFLEQYRSGSLSATSSVALTSFQSHRRFMHVQARKD